MGANKVHRHYSERGSYSRYKKVWDRKWEKLVNELGLSGPYPMLPNMKKLRQRIDAAGPYMIPDTNEGKWEWRAQ